MLEKFEWSLNENIYALFPVKAHLHPNFPVIFHFLHSLQNNPESSIGIIHKFLNYKIIRVIEFNMVNKQFVHDEGN